MEDRDLTADLLAQLRVARREARLTQDELAALAGLSRRTVHLLEKGEGAPRLATLARALDALGLDLTIAPRLPTERPGA